MKATRLSQELTTGGLLTVVGGVALLFSVIFAGSGVVLVAAGSLLVLFGVIVGALEGFESLPGMSSGHS